MNYYRRPYCLLSNRGKHAMDINQAEKSITDIAHHTLDTDILEGKSKRLSQEAINSIAEALFEAYSAGYKAHQSNQ